MTTEKTLSEAIEDPHFKEAVKDLTNQEKGSINVALLALQNALPALEKAGLLFTLEFNRKTLEF